MYLGPYALCMPYSGLIVAVYILGRVQAVYTPYNGLIVAVWRIQAVATNFPNFPKICIQSTVDYPHMRAWSIAELG